MKSKTLVSTLLLALAVAFVPLSSAESKSAPASDSEIIAKARAAYPLKTCLVSDESLGSMGDAAGYIHRVAGKPDRVVFFCCEGCTDDFKADPAKFLKKVDDAAKGKPAPATKAGKKSGHQHHP